jgi:uncharacterized phage protein (TIGR02218 family)
MLDVTLIGEGIGIVNGGFENGSANPPTGWTQAGTSGQVTLSYLTVAAYDGLQSLQVTGTIADVGVYQNVAGPWTTGQTFNVTGWIKNVTAGVNGEILVSYMNSSSGVISSVGRGWGGSGWGQVSVPCVIPAGTDYIQIEVRSAGVGTFCADDIQIAGVATSTPGWNGPTVTFSATQWGRWNRGAITSEASYDCKSNSMTLTCVPQPTTVYPGLQAGILAAAWNGLFDAVQVAIYTAYFPQGEYGTLPAGCGIETKFIGNISKINDINRTKVEFECADVMQLLGMKVPSRLFQANCPNQFGDSNCAPTGGVAAYTQAFTAAAGSNSLTLTPVTAFTQAAGYFTQGVVKCTSGANVGLSQTVMSHIAGVLTVMNPWLLPVQVGDTFSVVHGCDRSMASCSGLKNCAGQAQNNLIHFMGTPFVPPPSTAIG